MIYLLPILFLYPVNISDEYFEHFKNGLYISELHEQLEKARLKKDFFLIDTLLFDLLKDTGRVETVSIPSHLHQNIDFMFGSRDIVSTNNLFKRKILNVPPLLILCFQM